MLECPKPPARASSRSFGEAQATMSMSFTIPAALMSEASSGREGFCMWLPLLEDASATALASDAGITTLCGDELRHPSQPLERELSWRLPPTVSCFVI